MTTLSSDAERLAAFLEQFKTCGHQLEDGTPVHLAAAALLRRIPELEAELESAKLGESFHDKQANEYARQVAHWIGKFDEVKAERDQLRAELEKVRWQPIETAPQDMTECVVVRWVDSEGQEHQDFDYKEDGCWMRWHDHAAHVEVIGGHGVSYTPPYQHYMPLPAAPTPPHADQKGQ